MRHDACSTKSSPTMIVGVTVSEADQWAERGIESSEDIWERIDLVLARPYNKGVIDKIKLPTLKCLRCGYEWIPRQPKKPKYCARCNSPYWNSPKWKGVKGKS